MKLYKKLMDFCNGRLEKCCALIWPNPQNPSDDFLFCLPFMDYEKPYEIIFDGSKFLVTKMYNGHLRFQRIHEGGN